MRAETGKSRKGREREKEREQVRTSQIARKDACLPCRGLSLRLALCPPQMGTIPQMRERTPWAFGNHEGRERGEDGRRDATRRTDGLTRTRGSSLNQHAEFLEGIPSRLAPRVLAHSLARSPTRSSVRPFRAFDKSPPWICLSLWNPPEGGERSEGALKCST